MKANKKKASAPEQPVKRKKKRSGISGTLRYLLTILIVSAVLATTGILLSNDLFALAKPDRDITITIPEDASVGKVSKLLDKSGVVNYGSFFHLFTSIVYRDIEFRPGMWTLNSDMDYREIVNEIRLTSKSTVTVTIPEGYTIDDIIDLLVENGLSSETELKTVLQNSDFTYDFLPDDIGNETNSLEGYLFPDTYEFYLSDSAETIISKMLGNFENKINDDSDGKSLAQLCKEKDLSVSDMVIIASMVEKESVDADDMLNVSGVIWNRLDHASEYPYLNIDATIQYVVGHTDLTDADMKYDSPYNTYTSKGLPPGPICNPGYDALLAAVQPAVHDYYYYVANADHTAHIYAKTQEEQTANIAAVQKQKEASGN
ncbi:MAG: endolytic transglycosylase MltG [Clostridia bacterium]|nr:endolytic transglycosylase MltG [Clostridia bacterium]